MGRAESEKNGAVAPNPGGHRMENDHWRHFSLTTIFTAWFLSNFGFLPNPFCLSYYT
jgi:hypothetical protein